MQSCLIDLRSCWCSLWEKMKFLKISTCRCIDYREYCYVFACSSIWPCRYYYKCRQLFMLCNYVTLYMWHGLLLCCHIGFTFSLPQLVWSKRCCWVELSICSGELSRTRFYAHVMLLVLWHLKCLTLQEKKDASKANNLLLLIYNQNR